MFGVVALVYDVGLLILAVGLVGLLVCWLSAGLVVLRVWLLLCLRLTCRFRVDFGFLVLCLLVCFV